MKTNLDEMNPISILAFLKKFRDACDCVDIHEGVDTWLVSSFMNSPTSLSLEAQLSLRKIRATVLHDESISTYAEVVNYLLRTYATNGIIIQAIKESKSYKRALGVSAALSAKRLYAKTLWCKTGNKKKQFKFLFVEELDESISDKMRDYLGYHPRAPT